MPAHSNFSYSLFKTTVSKLAVSVCLSSAMILATTQTQAAVPNQSSIKELMKVTHVDNIIQQMPKQGLAVVDEVMLGIVIKQNVKQLSEAQKKQLAKISEKYVEKLTTSIDTPATRQALMDSFIKTTQKHYTQEEVDAQIKFYGSKVGQSIIKKQPLLMQEFTTAAVPQVMSNTKTSMQKLIPELEKEVKNAVK